jgi:hypothetical protein
VQQMASDVAGVFKARRVWATLACLACLLPVIVASRVTVADAQIEPTAHADCGPIPGVPKQVNINGNYYVSAKIKATCVLSADLIWLSGSLYMDGGLEAAGSKTCPTTRTCTFYLRAEDPPGVQGWMSRASCKYQDHGIIADCNPQNAYSTTEWT